MSNGETLRFASWFVAFKIPIEEECNKRGNISLNCWPAHCLTQKAALNFHTWGANVSGMCVCTERAFTFRLSLPAEPSLQKAFRGEKWSNENEFIKDVWPCLFAIHSLRRQSDVSGGRVEMVNANKFICLPFSDSNAIDYCGNISPRRGMGEDVVGP